MFKITQEDYDVIVFLTRLVYFDLEYPQPFKCDLEVKLGSGLKLNSFDMGEYQLFIICGTNSLVDWVANMKVALGFTPCQYDQAYYYIRQHSPHITKPIVIAGHSLGGGIAEYVTSSLYYYNYVTCLTFNGCGCSHLIHPILRKENDVFNIVTDKDILNCITRPLRYFGCYMQHTGKVIMMKDEEHILLSVGSHCNFRLFSKLDVQQLYE